LEVENKGDAKATANEQTTNLYMLNNSNDIILKKLKKIEELYEKKPELAKKLGREEIEKIASGNSQELQRQDILKETERFVKRFVADKNELILKHDEYFYHQLTNIALQSSRDDDVVAKLSVKLGRLR
jgi:hypothetical protein